MSNHLGNNFNKEEKEFITIPFDSIDEFVDNAFQLETSGTERFQVDSSGRILKPSTPAFLAYHQASDLNYAVNATLAFPYTLYNIGNHYNTS